MSGNSYQIPEVTEEICDDIQGRLIGSANQPTAIMELIRGDDENPNLAGMIDAISASSEDFMRTRLCGTRIYRLMELAYQSMEQQVPRVTEGTRNSFAELCQRPEEWEAYSSRIKTTLRKNNPLIIRSIEDIASISPDNELVTYAGLVVYGLIEKQVEKNLRDEWVGEIINGNSERADELRAQIKALTS